MAKHEQKLSFEDGLSRLEELVGALEQGKLPLAESFEAYEKGIKLLGQLEAQLSEHEAKIMLLTPKGEQPLEQEEN